VLCSSVVFLGVGGSRRKSIDNETCDVAYRRKCLRVCSRIVDRKNGILLWGCYGASSTISRGLVAKLELMVGVVCIVVVFGRGRCRGLPRRMWVGIEESLCQMCCCMFVLFVAVGETVVLFVVCCLRLLGWVLLVSAVVVKVLTDSLGECVYYRCGMLRDWSCCWLWCRTDVAKLCWCCCNWECRRVHVECSVVIAIFPIVRLLPMFHHLLHQLCISCVVVPMVVVLVVDVVEVLDVVVLQVDWLLELWEVRQCVDCCC
jgi:hypothetical protein